MNEHSGSARKYQDVFGIIIFTKVHIKNNYILIKLFTKITDSKITLFIIVY